MKLRKSLRWALVVGAVVSIGVLVAVAWGRWFLKREIVAQLTALNGAPVTVEGVALGFQRQAATGIRLLEGEGTPPAWLTARHAALELSLWEALWGQTVPHRMTVTDAEIVLRFDEGGVLLSRLPLAQDRGEWKLPGTAVEIVNAGVEIRQRGRDPLAIRSIDMQLRQRDASIQATGLVGDLLGGKWTFGGQFDSTTGRTTGDLATERIRARRDDLIGLPFVPTEILQDVDFDAATPVTISCGIAPSQDVHYRIELAPESYHLDVPRADLEWTNGRGTMLIEDGVLSLTHWQGEVFGGRVELDGRLDFREMPWQGSTQLKVENLGLAQLPETWRLPKRVAGSFTGQGSFAVEIAEAGPRLHGSGDGSIVDATIMGLAAEPIGIHVVIDRASGLEETSDAAFPVSGQVRVDIAIRDVNVGQALRRADLEAVESLRESAGSVSLSGSIRAPLESLDDPTTYQAEGHIELAEVELAGIEIREFRSQFAHSQGTLSFKQCVAQIGEGGRIRGEVKVGFGADEPAIVAKADFERFSSRLIGHFVDTAEGHLAGEFSGHVETAVAWDRWHDPGAWLVSGHAKSGQLDVGEITFADVTSQLRLDRGKLVLDKLSARRADTQLEGSATMGILEPFPFDGRLVVKGLDLAAIVRRSRVTLPVPVAGTAVVDLAGRGTLEPLEWNVDGTAHLPKLTADDFSAEAVRCEWSLAPDSLELKTVQAELLGGDIKLSGTVPLAGDDGVQLRGTFRNFDPSLLLAHVSPGSDLTIAGSLSGTITASHVEDFQRANGKVHIEGSLADGRGVAVDQVSGDLSFAGGTFGIDVSGKVFDGTVGFRGHARADDTHPEKPLQVAGRLTIDNANLARLTTIGGPKLRALEGRAAGELDLRLEGPDFPLAGEGRVVLQHVRWERTPLTDLAESGILLAGDMVHVTQASARVAGGTVTGDATFHLDRPGEGTFSLAADQVSLSQLPAVWRRVLGGATGSLAASFRGRMGQTWQGGGQVRLTNGSVAGVPIQSLRAPVDWAFAPRTGNVQARVRLTSARVAGGRVSGDVRARWSGRLDLAGNAKVVRVDVRTLAKAAPGLDDLLGGTASGEVEFGGTNVRSVQNLSGTFDAELVQSQALMLPVLEALTASLGFGSPSAETFSKTEAKGRFARGVLQIDRMTMVSPDTHLFIEGKMNHRGSLDFDVTADAKKAVTAGVVVGLFRPSSLLFRRLIFLHVGGSLRSPIVQPRVQEFIEREIVLFFVPFAAAPPQ